MAKKWKELKNKMSKKSKNIVNKLVNKTLKNKIHKEKDEEWLSKEETNMLIDSLLNRIEEVCEERDSLVIELASWMKKKYSKSDFKKEIKKRGWESLVMKEVE